jgi:flagellar hook-associated protein 2
MASEGVVDPTNPTKAKQGVLQSLIQQRNDAIKGLNDQVSAWDVRLESRKTALQRQFSNLEVALGKMQQQSSWLAGQLAGLA